MRKHGRAFTLIEILVVVAIIALLVAILLPALSSARASGRNAICLSNLHQAAAALGAYEASFRDYIPRGGTIQKYFSDGDITWVMVLLQQVDSSMKNVVSRAQAAGSAMASFNGKSFEARGIKLNELVWRELGRFPVFRCPERALDTPSKPEVLSYIANALDPIGAGKDVSLPTPVGLWRAPARVIYLTELELASVSTQVATKNLVPGTDLGDLSWFDCWRPPDFTGAPALTRGVARGIHSRPRRLNNTLYVDGHAQSVDALPRAGESVDSVSGSYNLRWMGYFGLE